MTMTRTENLHTEINTKAIENLEEKLSLTNLRVDMILDMLLPATGKEIQELRSDIEKLLRYHVAKLEKEVKV